MLYRIYNLEPKARDCISDTTLTRILYMAYDTAKLVISCPAKIFEIQVNLAEKIQVKVYANEDNFVSDIQTYDTVMISIVFCSLIIHEYYN